MCTPADSRLPTSGAARTAMAVLAFGRGFAACLTARRGRFQHVAAWRVRAGPAGACERGWQGEEVQSPTPAVAPQSPPPCPLASAPRPARARALHQARVPVPVQAGRSWPSRARPAALAGEQTRAISPQPSSLRPPPRHRSTPERPGRPSLFPPRIYHELPCTQKKETVLEVREQRRSAESVEKPRACRTSPRHWGEAGEAGEEA